MAKPMNIVEETVAAASKQMETLAKAAPITPPSALLMGTDIFRAGLEFMTNPLFAAAYAASPRGDGHPVLVLPGYATSDASTLLLRRYLKNLGYDVRAWKLGRNMGHSTIGPERQRLHDRVAKIAQDTGRSVTLVGWSLGGIMARLIAGTTDQPIRQIVTIGSPFTGSPYATNLWRMYERTSGKSFDHPEMVKELADSAAVPLVPSTAIYSKLDGITAWENCLDPEGENTESVQIVGSHMGLCVNPSVLLLLAERLAQPEGEWTHFDRSKMMYPWLYPAG